MKLRIKKVRWPDIIYILFFLDVLLEANRDWIFEIERRKCRRARREVNGKVGTLVRKSGMPRKISSEVKTYRTLLCRMVCNISSSEYRTIISWLRGSEWTNIRCLLRKILGWSSLHAGVDLLLEEKSTRRRTARGVCRRKGVGLATPGSFGCCSRRSCCGPCGCRGNGGRCSCCGRCVKLFWSSWLLWLSWLLLLF